jgi:hypothetical protein
MARSLLFVIIQGLIVVTLNAQAFSVDDLMTLSTLSPKKFDNYMTEKGYFSAGKQLQDEAMAFTFFEKQKPKAEDSVFENRRVGLYKKDNEYCFAFNTTSVKEYNQGLSKLMNGDFYYGEKKDTSQSPLFFQRKNIRVYVNTTIEEGIPVYSFVLKRKQLPSLVHFAEDLLSFDSHEYLVAYFGEENVQKDVYYFSEKKVKKCSVLYGNSNRQVVFVWEDENNLCKLSYVLISGVIPTENAIPFNDNISRNKWPFKSGIYSGMSIRDLLALNGNDFNFYGFDSEFALMVDPSNTGNIDFKKVGIMLSSLDGANPPLLKRAKVSAEQAVENRIALHVFYIMLTP